MKKIILILLIGLLGCKKEPEPKKIEDRMLIFTLPYPARIELKSKKGNYDLTDIRYSYDAMSTQVWYPCKTGQVIDAEFFIEPTAKKPYLVSVKYQMTNNFIEIKDTSYGKIWFIVK